MSESREDLERALLGDPFNGEVRGRYAECLLAAAEHAAALAQYEILIRQAPEAAPLHVGAARALLLLGQPAEAARRYAGARQLKGFIPHEELEAHLAATTRAHSPKLSVLEGGRSDNVVELGAPIQERTRFDDVAGLEDLKRTIRLQIIEPFLKPGLFAKFKKRAGGGVLLYGPPGCGKTMIARAVATECRAEFISVGISDVLNLYIGESERNLAALFEKARHSRPCVLFFDEIDALGFARSKAHSEHTRQIVNEFLAQLDGFGTDNHEVLILAATNMPWDVDSALKRPGRFSRQVFVPPPDEDARARIVELKLAGVPHDAIDSRAIAAVTPHFSGADIEGLVELAKDYVLEEHLTQNAERGVQQQDLLKAARSVNASTLDWLKTARNLVKYAGADDAYSEVGRYLKTHKLV
ncbi:MAG TPA: ATP-binding protein [Steroidobacteraceae bacterium]|jgi:SpoVK/Ycf46/Vps4 family AAA+-type ATPase